MRIFSGRMEKVSGEPVIGLRRLAADQVRDADKTGDKGCSGVLVDLRRGAHLLDLALVEHRQPVAHGQGFFLIVGDVDEGDPDPLLDGFQLDLHLLAQLQVQGAQRLIEQQHARMVDQGARQGDTLALPAGKLGRFPAGQTGQAHQVEHFFDPPLAFGLGTFWIIKPYATFSPTVMCGNRA